jgi:hypothetical protein
MSKVPTSTVRWVACLVLAAAFGAPASLADDPPTFPEPTPAPGEKPAAAPGTVPHPATPAPAVEPEALPAPGAGPAPAAVNDAAWVRWSGTSLRFEQMRFQGEARLYARSSGKPGWQVFRGQDLDAIVRASPTLAGHPELPALSAHVAGAVPVRVVVQGYAVGY